MNDQKERIIIEKGIIAGNLYDKYNSKNPITRWLTRNFQQTLIGLIPNGVTDIHEVGCGEGHLSAILVELPNIKKIIASDFSSKIINKAKI